MRACVRERVCRAVLGLLALYFSPAVSRAQVAYAGAWQAGASALDVEVKSWGKDCGPQPVSSRSSGGGRVRIEAQGQVLVIRGERDFRSDQCWSPNPAMRRQGSRYENDVWTTRCMTPATDPREESGVYTLKALSADRLLYQDVSRFNWKLKDSTCSATITTTQTLHRLETDATPGKGAVTKPVAAPCVPGAAKRLVLRPRGAELALGERECFEPRLFDQSGCAIKGAPIVWSLEHGKAIKARLEGGCFLAGRSSAESEGTFTVIASYQGLRAEANVAVSATSLPSLLAKRLESGGVVGLEGEEGETPVTALPLEAEKPSPTTRVSARALSQSHERQPWRWLALALAVLALVGASLLLLRRGGPRTPPSSMPVVARTLRCPQCGTVYPEGTAFCGVDGSAL